MGTVQSLTVSKQVGLECNSVMVHRLSTSTGQQAPMRGLQWLLVSCALARVVSRTGQALVPILPHVDVLAGKVRTNANHPTEWPARHMVAAQKPPVGSLGERNSQCSHTHPT